MRSAGIVGQWLQIVAVYYWGTQGYWKIRAAHVRYILGLSYGTLFDEFERSFETEHVAVESDIQRNVSARSPHKLVYIVPDMLGKLSNELHAF